MLRTCIVISLAGCALGLPSLGLLAGYCNDVAGDYWFNDGSNAICKMPATDPNGLIPNLNVKNVVIFDHVFAVVDATVPDLSQWDVTNGVSFVHSFTGADVSGANIANWNVTNGRNFSYMFSDARISTPNAMTEPIHLDSWKVSNGIDFSYMFSGTRARCPTGVPEWDVSKGMNFNSMFQDALYACDLTKWDISSGTSFTNMFRDNGAFDLFVRNDVSRQPCWIKQNQSQPGYWYVDETEKSCNAPTTTTTTTTVQHCTGHECAAACTDSLCGYGCIGNSCAANCTTKTCGEQCIGKNCAKGCTGPQCGLYCFHFENETCADNDYSIEMGSACSESFDGYMSDDDINNVYDGIGCETKNHPAVWQALKATEQEGDPIILPEPAAQCFFNGGGCVPTVDSFPPLICRVPVWDCVESGTDTRSFQHCTNDATCGQCQGHCVLDTHCTGDLQCFVRTGSEAVPGCSMSSQGSSYNVAGKGYCTVLPPPTSKSNDVGAIVGGTLGSVLLVGGIYVFGRSKGWWHEGWWHKCMSTTANSNFNEVVSLMPMK